MSDTLEQIVLVAETLEDVEREKVPEAVKEPDGVLEPEDDVVSVEDTVDVDNPEPVCVAEELVLPEDEVEKVTVTVGEPLEVEDAVYDGDIDTVVDIVRVTDSGIVPVLTALRVSLVVTVEDADTQLLVVGEAVEEDVAELDCDDVTVGHEVDVALIE